MTTLLENELETTSAALHTTIGENYQTYIRLLESFLCGRMTKEELEGALRVVLCDDLTQYELHNKYIGLVLEKLAAVESEAIHQCQTMSIEVNHKESKVLDLNGIKLTPEEKVYFTEATKQELPVAPFAEEEEQLLERQQAEFSASEKLLGRPLLCQLAGALPDAAALRAILTSWLKAYELDPASIEDEHLSLISQGMEDYLKMIIEKVKHRNLGTERLNLNHLAAAYTTNHLPIIISDLLLYEM